ncbi:MAG: FAD-dependent thymidylate synthase [Actinobacteria bacterium]|nr:FAD-dependent thymidylate synthase [Cyanobacteriota bacterium]MCL6086927.1 FAD-dependent thymidylate synthase [Actinomycetota bacterium]
MKVKLIRHTPEPEKLVAIAARLCYSPVGVEELDKQLDDEAVRKLIRFVINSGHLSTTEHAYFTFAIEGISRVLSHQLVRHRIASFNQQSQRYVKFKGNYEYITPDSIKQNEKINEKYKNFIADIHKFYEEMLNEGIEAEDARYILPNSSETKMIVTMNARELLHFFTVRCCNRAQKEIRDLAIEMLKNVKKVAPVIFENAGPNCLRIPCPEGKFTCGRPPLASDFEPDF